MRFVIALAVAALGITALAPAAQAGPHEREQNQAWNATRKGSIMPLRVIESRIVSRMRGFDYLGPELDGHRYRLKFMRGGQIVWIDVDARTGEIIGRSGF